MAVNASTAARTRQSSRIRRYVAVVMNPLTQIKNTQKVTKLEVASGISDSASWHARFKHSAYVFAGGLDYGLTEGDLLAVFAQFGEIVDVDLVRDKDSGESSYLSGPTSGSPCCGMYKRWASHLAHSLGISGSRISLLA